MSQVCRSDSRELGEPVPRPAGTLRTCLSCLSLACLEPMLSCELCVTGQGTAPVPWTPELQGRWACTVGCGLGGSSHRVIHQTRPGWEWGSAGSGDPRGVTSGRGSVTQEDTVMYCSTLHSTQYDAAGPAWLCSLFFNSTRDRTQALHLPGRCCTTELHPQPFSL